MTGEEAIYAVNKLGIDARFTVKGNEIKCYVLDEDECSTKSYLSAGDCRLLANAFASLAERLAKAGP